MLKLLLGFARSLHRMQTGIPRRQLADRRRHRPLPYRQSAFPNSANPRPGGRRASKLLKEHAEKDFFADGGHGERCWGYGHMSLGAMAHFLQDRGLAIKAWTPRPTPTGSRSSKEDTGGSPPAPRPEAIQLNYGDGGIGPADGIIAEAIGSSPS